MRKLQLLLVLLLVFSSCTKQEDNTLDGLLQQNQERFEQLLTENNGSEIQFNLVGLPGVICENISSELQSRVLQMNTKYYYTSWVKYDGIVYQARTFSYNNAKNICD